eukprot:CAMPEP_0170525140 /NCGR_PEP_ID=MMETSP0209-20121228/10597_1 /TAXON_ID=665100 ORGANISM="Litonotus pictus, Strain P1" /NCGR_SAMPLE_ID=MMETSP0209 /ASSEMBLY_ACC=CAM_ASM_000301 /LENGTH=204 /DNA_ID=CAMNT_0010814225 /DNA_START=182 /DNA_END=793 /DNA_ORIENTATION=-
MNSYHQSTQSTPINPVGSLNYLSNISNSQPSPYSNNKGNINITYNTNINSKPHKYSHLESLSNFEFIKLGSEYHLLGEGSYGEVILSRNKHDQKFYAVKRLKKSAILANGGNLSQIYQEVSLHKTLKHRNIIRLYSFLEDSDYFYLVMEYAKAGNLFEVIQLRQNLDENSCFKFFIQVLSAVLYLHQKGLVHRDLKPENLLLDE